MRYAELSLQTHRAAPANVRSQGAAWLIRAGYISHSGQTLPMGERALTRIQTFLSTSANFRQIGLTTLKGAHETYYPTPVGTRDLLFCQNCGYAARAETAQTQKVSPAPESAAPLEKVPTPNCPTIESLAVFLGISAAQTAKALMFVREQDQGFLFVVIRGDTTLSEAKLEALVGKFRLATEAEIRAVGAIPGYASPVGVQNAQIIIDDLITNSANLVAGANQAGYHLLHTNHHRDYSANRIADLTQANPGEACLACGSPLAASKGWVLASAATFDPDKILLALAELHHDEKGLTLPALVAPFEIYLMQVPGKTLETLPAAQDLYKTLTTANLTVFFDDRNERAGVKFNDADLVGCPIRITLGERGLQTGVVEVKERQASEPAWVGLSEVIHHCQSILQRKTES